MSRPHFIRALLSDLIEDWDREGWKGVLPVKLVPCLAVGAVVAWTVPDFWGSQEKATRIDIFIGFAALNGLLLALAWGAFSKIYETTSAPGFSQWLAKHGLQNTIDFHVSFIQAAQTAALALSGANLVLTLYGVSPYLPLWLHQAGLMLVVAATIYALIYALGGVTIMQDLVAHRVNFENHPKDKVVDMPRSEDTSPR